VSLCFSITVNAAELVVIYPQVREPFARVFEEIVRGAEDGYHESPQPQNAGQQSTQRVSMDENQSPVDFIHVLDQASPVLVLGNRLAGEVSAHNPEHKVIVGAVSTEYSNVFGITLTPGFKVIANKLSALVPAVRTVHVVVGSEADRVEFETAAKVFAQRGLSLVVHPASDIRSAAAIYRGLTKQLSEDDAVWILPDGSFVGDAMLSILLQASWEKHFVVFSSNPVHVKRGALFSIYPNNYKMGLSLGRLAQEVASGRVPQRQMQPLDDVFVAVNGRTGNHLGINFTEDVLRHIDVVLPAR
jgi:putative ABC transport system substrate-binding protein